MKREKYMTFVFAKAVEKNVLKLFGTIANKNKARLIGKPNATFDVRRGEVISSQDCEASVSGPGEVRGSYSIVYYVEVIPWWRRLLNWFLNLIKVKC